MTFSTSPRAASSPSRPTPTAWLSTAASASRELRKRTQVNIDKQKEEKEPKHWGGGFGKVDSRVPASKQNETIQPRVRNQKRTFSFNSSVYACFAPLPRRHDLPQVTKTILSASTLRMITYSAIPVWIPPPESASSQRDWLVGRHCLMNSSRSSISFMSAEWGSPLNKQTTNVSSAPVATGVDACCPEVRRQRDREREKAHRYVWNSTLWPNSFFRNSADCWPQRYLTTSSASPWPMKNGVSLFAPSASLTNSLILSPRSR